MTALEIIQALQQLSTEAFEQKDERKLALLSAAARSAGNAVGFLEASLQASALGKEAIEAAARARGLDESKSPYALNGRSAMSWEHAEDWARSADEKL